MHSTTTAGSSVDCYYGRTQTRKLCSPFCFMGAGNQASQSQFPASASRPQVPKRFCWRYILRREFDSTRTAGSSVDCYFGRIQTRKLYSPFCFLAPLRFLRFIPPAAAQGRSAYRAGTAGLAGRPRGTAGHPISWAHGPCGCRYTDRWSSV